MSLVRLPEFDSFRAMTTSECVCLFHNRQYSSNIQRILNLLRVNIIAIKCDLNLIVKRSLCTCELIPNQMQIIDEQLQQDFEKLKVCPWFEEVNQIIQINIMKTCDSKIALYKLLQLICEIANDEKYSKIIKNIRKEEKGNQTCKYLILFLYLVHPTKSNLIRRRIELTLSPNQMGHLLGRGGQFHKQIMTNTNTRIHFENAPYSIKLYSKRDSEFNLDLFQSSCPLIAIITGDTLEAVESATKALEKRDQDVQVRKRFL